MTGWRGLTLRDRFEQKYIPEPTSGCWLWVGHTVKLGYGTIRASGRPWSRAHRVSYELFKGPIPKGFLVCHRCDVRCCVNPDHLFLGTPAENSADCVRKGRSKTMGTDRRGEDHNTAKLRTEDVLKIRNDQRKTADIAKEFGVTPRTIRQIIARQSWAHLP